MRALLLTCLIASAALADRPHWNTLRYKILDGYGEVVYTDPVKVHNLWKTTIAQNSSTHSLWLNCNEWSTGSNPDSLFEIAAPNTAEDALLAKVCNG